MDTLFYIVILIFSVIAHEIAHGYVADYLGDSTARREGRLTLNPVPHIDLFGSVVLPALLALSKAGFIIGWAKPVPYNPHNLRNQRWGTLAVAVAGVAVNFVIALFFGLIVRFAPLLGLENAAFLKVASMVCFLNIVLGVFNLVPIPPLDGSKVLFSLLPPRFYHFEALLERYSLILVVFLVFFLWRFIVPVVFLFFSLITGTFPQLGF
ncbi:site-2 protease family protein [Candidatus Parcubacteria bacterium]|nr:site-2 protease family protein [Candidatus Parcubacteria bacterium]